MNPHAEHFTAFMAAYKLSHPVSPDDQRYILGRRKRSLKELLKKKGAYGAVIAAIIAVNIIFRKAGIRLTLLQTKIMACLIAATVSTASVAGTYGAALYINHEYDTSKTVQEKPHTDTVHEIKRDAAPDLTTDDQIKKYYNKLEEIYLDDGSRFIGAVINQNRETIRIHTVHGVIQLPVKSIKTIKLR